MQLVAYWFFLSIRAMHRTKMALQLKRFCWMKMGRTTFYANMHIISHVSLSPLVISSIELFHYVSSNEINIQTAPIYWLKQQVHYQSDFGSAIPSAESGHIKLFSLIWSRKLKYFDIKIVWCKTSDWHRLTKHISDLYFVSCCYRLITRVYSNSSTAYHVFACPRTRHDAVPLIFRETNFSISSFWTYERWHNSLWLHFRSLTVIVNLYRESLHSNYRNYRCCVMLSPVL